MVLTRIRSQNELSPKSEQTCGKFSNLFSLVIRSEKQRKKRENGMNEAWRDAVLLTLGHACSQDPSLIKEAEGKLKAWETEPGFYSLLMVRLAY